MSLIESILVSLRLRKTKKTHDPEKTQQPESSGIMNITPAETRLVSFEMKSRDIAPPEPAAVVPDTNAEKTSFSQEVVIPPKIVAPDIGAEKTELKLEDELPEVKEMPVKKERKKKKPAKKVPGEVVEQASKEEKGTPSEKIPIHETEKVKPKKKEIKRRKPAAKKEPAVKPEKEAAKEKI